MSTNQGFRIHLCTFLLVHLPLAFLLPENEDLTIVVNTWAFTNATRKAQSILQAGGSAVDAVVQGCTLCEVEQCDFTVGYGGSPDEMGETTLDAMIMDGSTMAAGAVANLQHVRGAIATARLVMDRTTHTLLGGQQASTFAVSMGQHLASTKTPASTNAFWEWQQAKCQPNFRRGVLPDPRISCGPYRLSNSLGSECNVTCNIAAPECHQKPFVSTIDEDNHDTISMVAIDAAGRIAAGSSSNGASHKVPGRVGDAAVPGGGAYASPDGGCASTGDGDVHLRFQPCILVVEAMRGGASPQQAAESAVQRMARWFPHYVGALVALNLQGEHAAAAHGWRFRYAVGDAKEDVRVIEVEPLDAAKLTAS